MPMTNEFLSYFQMMGLNPAFRARIEQAINQFEAMADQWMPGAVVESVFVMPGKDIMGNPSFELWLFGADAVMSAGVLYMKAPNELVVRMQSLHKRVQAVRLRGRNYDPLTPDSPVSEGSELSVEFQLEGEAKKEEYFAKGQNCRHLQQITTKHITANFA